jgi:hypothetical protein
MEITHPGMERRASKRAVRNNPATGSGCYSAAELRLLEQLRLSGQLPANKMGRPPARQWLQVALKAQETLPWALLQPADLCASLLEATGARSVGEWLKSEFDLDPSHTSQCKTWLLRVWAMQRWMGENAQVLEVLLSWGEAGTDEAGLVLVGQLGRASNWLHSRAATMVARLQSTEAGARLWREAWGAEMARQEDAATAQDCVQAAWQKAEAAQWPETLAPSNRRRFWWRLRKVIEQTDANAARACDDWMVRDGVSLLARREEGSGGGCGRASARAALRSRSLRDTSATSATSDAAALNRWVEQGESSAGVTLKRDERTDIVRRMLAKYASDEGSSGQWENRKGP